MTKTKASWVEKVYFILYFRVTIYQQRKSGHELKRGRNIKTETGEDVTNVY